MLYDLPGHCVLSTLVNVLYLYIGKVNAMCLFTGCMQVVKSIETEQKLKHFMKFWLLTSILLLTITNVFAQSRDTLRVGYHLDPPFVEVWEGELRGPSVWLWENVAEENKIPYQLYEFTLDSLLHKIADGSIDLSMSPLTITSERAAIITFSSPYYITHSSIMQRDVSGTLESLDFMRAFFSMHFFQMLVVLTIIVFTFGFLVWLFERRAKEENFGRNIYGLWSAFWWSTVTMTTVGYGDKIPQTIGGKIVAYIWMFTAIIIISGFTASIASSLTVSNIGSSTNAVQDYKDKRIGSIEGSSTDKWLKNNFFNNKKTFSGIPELIDALDKEKVEGIAYARPLLQRLIKVDSLSEYKVSSVNFNPQFYAMAINRRLPDSLKHIINLSILNNVETIDWKVLLSEYDLNYTN